MIRACCRKAKRSAGKSARAEITEQGKKMEADQAIYASLQWAREHPDTCMDYIREYAQEMSDEVLQSHIGLYVNDFSLYRILLLRPEALLFEIVEYLLCPVGVYELSSAIACLSFEL